MFLHLSVSHSVHRGVSASVHAGIHTPAGQTHPPFPVHAGIDSATAADGTHPTGMHSCLVEISKYRSGMVNSNTVNSKFHLIRSYCEYLARILSFHV